MAAQRDPIDHTERLASELLSSVFGILPRPSLLAAAGVSRRWRAAATRERQYYRLAVFEFPVYPDERGPLPGFLTLRSLEEIVRESEMLKYPLGIRIDDSRDDWGYDSEDDDEATLARDAAWLAKNLVPLLQRAAPRLVLLHIEIYATFAPVLFNALSTPAPMINDVTLVVCLPERRDLPSPVPFPQNLFGGHTHLITEMYVGNLDIRAQSMPPFPAVHTLGILYDQEQMLESLHEVFPAARHLAIDAIAHDGPLPAEEFGLFDKLTSLVVNDEDSLTALEPVLRKYSNVPLIHFCAAKEVTSRSLIAPFLRFSGPVKLALTEHFRTDRTEEAFTASRETQLRALLSYLDHGIERCVDADIDHSRTFKLLKQVGCAQQLTMLEIDDAWVSRMPRALGALPVLQTLAIVVIFWAISDAETPICRCKDVASCGCFQIKPFDNQDLLPSLRTIRLTAAIPQATVRQRELHWLSHAFAPQACAPLHLEITHGLSLAPGTDADEVAKMFGSVTSCLASFTPPHELQARARYLRSALVKRLEQIQALSHMMIVFGDDDRLEYC